MSAPVGLPQFSHIDVSNFKNHLQQMLNRHLEQIENLLRTDHTFTWDNLMYPLEDMEDELERFWSPMSHLQSVMDSPALRKCDEECMPLLSAYEAAIGHNIKLYEAIKSIDSQTLNSVQKKIIDDNLKGFELSGVTLTEESKKRFEVVQARLDELDNLFEHNILDATQAFTIHVENSQQLQGIPEHALATAKQIANEKELSGYLFTLEAPSYQAVLTYAEDRNLREQMYYAYATKASELGPHANTYDNSPIMNEMLALRQEKAQLLGFKNFAELSVARKMAESTEQVVGFMQDLVKRARPQAQKELEELKYFASTLGIDEIQPWDIAYLSEKRKKSLYTLTQEELRPYFPQPKVMQGLFSLIKQLFGMNLEEIKGVDVWHKDVQCFAVVDNKNQLRGYVYTDLYARPNKHSGAWMDSLQSRRRLEDGTIQLPIATLTCNFAKASNNKPALLSHDEVVTLFHEFGHCLHHLLTEVDYLGASGINGVEWDAVELPSQFLENWCWEKEPIRLLSAHIETGESLPPLLFQKLIDSKNFQSAMSMIRQMEFSLFDFILHQEYVGAEQTPVNKILAKVRYNTCVIPVAEYNRFQNSFSHIFGGGYAAGYYSYSWAEVLSCDAFSRFEEEGVLNPTTGQDFLECILEKGGSQKAAELFKNFRGRPANIDALLRHNGIGNQ